MAMKHTLLLLAFLWLLLGTANAAFLVAKSCNPPRNHIQLEAFVVDAALDQEKQVLKFFINSEVIKRHPFSERWNQSNQTNLTEQTTEPLVTDVNTTTNRYTTFHALVLINHDTLADEYLRFCDMVVVKNISNFNQVLQQYRNESTDTTTSSSTRTSTKTTTTPSSSATTVAGNSTNSSSIRNSSRVTRKNNYISRRKREDFTSISKRDLSGLDYNFNFANSNSTVEALFAHDNGLRRCPLHHEDSIMFYYEVKIPAKYHSSLSSFKATFSVISNDEDSDVLGCYTVIVTPVRYRQLQEIVSISTLTVLVVAAVLNVFTIMFSSSQESSNPFLHMASSICNGELLAQLDANASTVVQYFQFAYFMGSMGLDYPGFYQPLVLQFRWVCLIWVPFLGEDTFDDKYIRQDNVYLSFDAGGFNILKYYSSLTAFRYMWPNFLIALFTVCFAVVVFQQIILFVIKKFRNFETRRRSIEPKKPTFKLISLKNLYFILGQILNLFYNTFAFPFLVITSFTIYSTASFSGTSYAKNNLNANQRDAFNPSVPYTALRIPWQCYENRNHAFNTTRTTLSRKTANVTELLRSEPSTSTYYFNTTTPFARGQLRQFTMLPRVNIALASLFFAIWILVLIYGFISVRVKVKRWAVKFLKSASKLYTSMKTILLWGFAYYNLKPTKVYFVGVNLVKLLSELFIIGYLQDYGFAQVNCIIIIEVIYFLLLFLCKPYFLPMTWGTLRLWIPFFRILSILLCIPYVSVLGMSENAKARAAYAQLLVHGMVAIYFILRLTYCMWITCKPFVMSKLESYNSKHAKTSKPVVNDYDDEFEFQPVVKSNSIKRSKVAHDDYAMYTLERLTKSSITDIKIMPDERDLSDDYYRHNRENYLRRFVPTPSDSESGSYQNTSVESLHVILSTDSSSASSFAHEQEESKLRLQNNNYAFREGDFIYKKYINDEGVDVEIKELWDMRMSKLCEKETLHHRKDSRNQPSAHSKNSSYTATNSSFGRLMFWNKLKPTAPSFEVCRPRHLVVRTMDDVKSLDKA